MSTQFPITPQVFIKDLNDADPSEKSLHIASSAKNIASLKELHIENLWITGLNQKEFEKIIPLIRVKYLNIYAMPVNDLSLLETLSHVETMDLTWNSKATSLWDFRKNHTLKTLVLHDFSKVQDISQLSAATQLQSLTIGGGFGKPMKIKSLTPLSSLTDLNYLSLSNIKVEGGSLQPLAKLKKLKTLIVSNQFETREYAWLATRLPDTKCALFHAISPCSIIDADGNLAADTMITGRRKPFLLSTKDQARIEKYIADFEKLKMELAD